MQYNDYSRTISTKYSKRNDLFVADSNVLSYFVADRMRSFGNTYNSSAEIYGEWQEKARRLQARRWRRIKGYAG